MDKNQILDEISDLTRGLPSADPKRITGFEFDKRSDQRRYNDLIEELFILEKKEPEYTQEEIAARLPLLASLYGSNYTKQRFDTEDGYCIRYSFETDKGQSKSVTVRYYP